MSTVSEYLENLIKECGGFGKYQLLLTILLSATKISVSWTMLMMTFAGATPEWWCVSESDSENLNRTSKVCTPVNTSQCISYLYDDDMDTVVNQWNLICDKVWVSTTITSIQMAGVLIGGLMSGQMGDYFGRKPTLFAALLLITASNFLAFFSVSWQMFAVLRFFMGVSSGMILTVYIVLLYEFVQVDKRPIIAGFPCWALFASLFALVAWLLHDWKYLHFATAATSAPLLLSWWFIPESFRWLVVHHRFDEARAIIRKMARFNCVPVPDISDLENLEDDTKSKYTFVDIFKGKQLLKTTVVLAFMWMTCGYVYYAISFSVENFSGNLYLNMFLVSAIVVPSNCSTIWLNSKIGRKWTAFGYFLVCAFGSLAVAVIQALNISVMEGKLVNGFALLSKLGCSAGWTALELISAEIYPTVIRNLGYGFQNTAARVGSVIAPQMIFLSTTIPGFLYFLCSALMIISAVGAAMSTETGGRQLEDTIRVKFLTTSSKPLISSNNGRHKHQVDETSTPI